jgi:hypothetical protein
MKINLKQLEVGVKYQLLIRPISKQIISALCSKISLNKKNCVIAILVTQNREAS